MTTLTFASGGYRFIPAVFQYSGGVAAEPGYRIERVTFRDAGAARGRVSRASRASSRPRGRPLTAFCACELRSPEPFTEAGFRPSTSSTSARWPKWGIYRRPHQPGGPQQRLPRDRAAGRALASMPSPSPSPARDAAPSFFVAGSGEAREGERNYREHTVRYGDLSPQGLAEKARWVLGEMERPAGRARLSLGRRPRPPRSTPCTISTRSSPARSCRGARPAPG